MLCSKSKKLELEGMWISCFQWFTFPFLYDRSVVDYNNSLVCFYIFTENKRNTKVPVARLLLVVQEAHDLMPSPTTLERHR
jgi:hypothetical protein